MTAAAEVLEIVRPLTVVEFHRMLEAGILDPEERIELIDGVLTQMVAMNPRHASLVKRIARMLMPLESRRLAMIREEKALVLGERDELYPDVCVARFREDDYALAHPTAEDALLVVEVADTTLGTDRRVKGPRYAEAGIPEYWIVNVQERRIEAYREPVGGEYRMNTAAGARLAPLGFAELEVDVAELFRFL